MSLLSCMTLTSKLVSLTRHSYKRDYYYLGCQKAPGRNGDEHLANAQQTGVPTLNAHRVPDVVQTQRLTATHVGRHYYSTSVSG